MSCHRLDVDACFAGACNSLRLFRPRYCYLSVHEQLENKHHVMSGSFYDHSGHFVLDYIYALDILYLLFIRQGLYMKVVATVIFWSKVIMSPNIIAIQCGLDIHNVIISAFFSF